MPWEAAALKDAPSPIERCPKCKAEPFDPMMRGLVQRRRRSLWLRPRPYCALICYQCKQLVGWESPPEEGAHEHH